MRTAVAAVGLALAMTVCAPAQAVVGGAVIVSMPFAVFDVIRRAQRAGGITGSLACWAIAAAALPLWGSLAWFAIGRRRALLAS